MAIKEKRSGLGLDIRMFQSKNGESYIVFKTTKGSYHVFKEVEAKRAAVECGAKVDGNPNTRRLWGSLWKQTDK